MLICAIIYKVTLQSKCPKLRTFHEPYLMQMIFNNEFIDNQRLE